MLAKVLRHQGEDVRVGEVLGAIEAAGATSTGQEAGAPTILPAEGAHGDGEGDRVPAGKATGEAGKEADQAGGPQPAVILTETPAGDDGKVSPLARRRCRGVGR